MNLLLRLVVACGLAAGAAASAQQLVDVPSLDPGDGNALSLPGIWYAAGGAAAAPAVVLLHGCGGLFDGRGRLGERYVEMAQRLNALGIHALVPDSLGPRGEKEICTQRAGSRRVTMVERRRDALGALQWLAAQPGVDANRLALLGWSNGGSTVLNALADSADMRAAWGGGPGFVAAVAFYPGCGSAAVPMRRYETRVPLMVLHGDADEEVSADVCARLLAGVTGGAGGSTVGFKRYAGAAHDFDDPGHQSDPANAAARQDAVAEAEAFFRARLAR